MMLIRAVRRNARPELVRNRFLSKHIPRLIPRCNGPRRWVTYSSIGSGSHRLGLGQKQRSEKSVSAPNQRRMAMAAFCYGLDDIPLESLNGPLAPIKNLGDTYRQPLGESDLMPIYLNNLGRDLPSRPVLRPGKLGLSGDYIDIQPVFEACLSVGRIKRATAILEKLLLKNAIPNDEAVYWINRYLCAAVEQIMMNPSESAIQSLHTWFELNIRTKAAPQNTVTIAYMVKLSLQSVEGRRERLVRRYMDTLDEESVLSLLDADILTAYEVSIVAQIYPKYNLSIEMDEEEMIKFEEDQLDELTEPSRDILDNQVQKVRETQQKGLGLRAVQKSLSLFTSLPLEGIDLKTADLDARREIQRRLEDDAVESAIERWRNESSQLTKMGINSLLQTRSMGSRMWQWQLRLEDLLKKELKEIDKAEDSEKMTQLDHDRCLYGPLLRVLPPNKLAATTILSCMTTMGQHSDKRIPLATIVMDIAKSVEDESTLQVLRQAGRKNFWPKVAKMRLSPKFMQKMRRVRGPGAAARHMVQSYAQEGVKSWSGTIRAKVGAFLMSALIETAKVPVSVKHPDTGEVLVQMQPAFYHTHQYKRGKKTGVIMMNNILVGHMKREPVHSLLAKYLPMLVEPNPWTAFSDGGYLVHPSKVMRIKNGDQDQRYYCESAIGRGGMETIFKGLNVLGKTSWRINQPVFDTMLEAWNTGEAIANIPPLSPNLETPAEPLATSDPLERGRWIKQVKLNENLKSGMHSQRCFMNFQLEIARALKDQAFHFPHNVDFRGRAYPIPPYLNHIGADHCRGLLIFGEGKELGYAGLRWLRIHLSNVFGYDKASLQEREAFATSKLTEIYDSALKPLTGNRWWLQAEDPWQCLAACIEIRNALESPDPTKFVSHLPVHQDGTCNGLQHYAALGGDSWGAQQVNLEPGDRPADVYTAVADLVRASITEDKQTGHPLAVCMDGKITRKTVKQTVMTNVYGVTFIGAKAQVRKQLVAAHPNLPNTPEVNPGTLASYVATKIFTALSTMFRGAHDIQFWLAECANRISGCIDPRQIEKLECEWDALQTKESTKKGSVPGLKERGPSLSDLSLFKSSVIWTSPLNMPIVQPYRTARTRKVRTNMQSIALSEPNSTDPISRRKQLQGFPPNFIHSLDASHMILSALGCDRLGLSFAAVHDSFWTHACDIDTMNDVLRDSFIEIHKQDIIGRLAAEFDTRYKGSLYHAALRSGTPLHQKVIDWRKSNKYTPDGTTITQKTRKAAELLLESKRQSLLASSDPEKARLGKEMVTPGSIVEAWAKEGDMVIDEAVGAMKLGYLPQNLSENSSNVGKVEESDVVDQEGHEFIGHDEHFEKDHAAEGLNNFEKKLVRPQARSAYLDWVWLPLSFPAVPKKGAFDVSRLKDSKYFFS